MCSQPIRALRVPSGQCATHRLLLVMWRCLPPHSCCWAPPVSLVPLAWSHRLPFLQPHPHYRGQCRWNCGAHMAYASDAGTLCPDCWLHWARSIAACPVDQGLLTHLLRTAEQCQVGAGQHASMAPSLRLKHVRRWLLASIRRQNGATLAALERELTARGVPGSANPQHLLLRAARARCSEGGCPRAAPGLKRMCATFALQPHLYDSTPGLRPLPPLFWPKPPFVPLQTYIWATSCCFYNL